MTADNKNPVATPCNAYTQMSRHWELIDDLLGGTQAMRDAGTKWLPREPKEDEESYSARLNRSILFTGYEDAVDDLVSRPFSKPVTIQGDLPDLLKEMPLNVDGLGTNITQFARELFDTLLNRGLCHILVDYPKTPAAEGKPLTVAQEKRSGVRPVFIQIKPDQLIGWRFVVENGKIVLDMIRWLESRYEPDGMFGEKKVESVRVYTRTGWQVWKKDSKNEYVISEEGTHTYPDGVPLTTCYITKTGEMTAEPPLEGLAWQNLAHWQSYSDQKNLLRFARFPLLFFKGLTEIELEKDVVIGPGRKWASTNENADCKYVEHTGAAIDAGRQDLKDVEDRMTALGLEPLVSRSGGQTATGQSIDEAKSQSSIQSWIRSLENTLRNAFKIAAKWVRLEIPDDFKVDIYNDFGVSVRSATDIDALLRIRQAKELDRETFLKEVKRRALLGENVDVQDVMERIESEGPAFGDMLGDGLEDEPGNSGDDE